MNSSDVPCDDGNGSSSMIACLDCGSLVPANNLELHRLRACPSTRDSSGLQHRETTISLSNLVTTSNIYASAVRSRTSAENDGLAVATSTSTSTLANSPSHRPRKTRRSNTNSNEDVIMRSSSSSDNDEIINLMDDEDEDRKPSARDTTTSSNNIAKNDIINLIDEANVLFDTVQEASASSAAARSQTVDLTSGNGDDEEEEDRKMPAREGTPDTDPRDDEWTCPRCTLHNNNTSVRCDACQYINTDIRQRMRQNDSTAHGSQSAAAFPPEQEQPFAGSSPIGFISSGALLGAAVGMAGNWIQGRNTLSGAVEGGTTGAVGGALLHEVLNSNNRDRQRATSRAQAGFVNHERRNRNSPFVEISDVTRETDSRDTNMDPRVSTRVREYQLRSRSTSNQDDYSHRLSGTNPYRNNTYRTLVQNRQNRMAERLTVEQFLQIGNPQIRVHRVRSMNGGLAPNIDGMSYDQLLNAFGNGTENMGATQGEIGRLPTHVVGDKSLPEDARQCLICLEDFEKGESRTILPCLHGFHKKCCGKWLATKAKCPICNHPISSNG